MNLHDIPLVTWPRYSLSNYFREYPTNAADRVGDEAGVITLADMQREVDGIRALPTAVPIVATPIAAGQLRVNSSDWRVPTVPPLPTAARPYDDFWTRPSGNSAGAVADARWREYYSAMQVGTAAPPRTAPPPRRQMGDSHRIPGDTRFSNVIEEAVQFVITTMARHPLGRDWRTTVLSPSSGYNDPFCHEWTIGLRWTE